MTGIPMELQQTTPVVSDDEREERAIAAAEALVRAAGDIERATGVVERTKRRRFAKVVQRPALQQFTVEVADEVLRAPTPADAMDTLRAVVRRGDLSDLGVIDRTLVRAAVVAGRWVPAPILHAIRRRLRWETSAVIIGARPSTLHRHLERRREAGMRSNLNVLGEAILSDAEAERRVGMILARLADPDVNYVSVKLSAISARIHILAFDETVAAVAEPLRRILRAAAQSQPAKFVNLDMEEYRDLHLTATLFRRTLDEPEFRNLRAGIVLQAYLPDSHDVARSLAEWAAERVRQGGAPIKIRIVKGANLAMENVDAEMHGWPAAPYATKAEVDASYKRLLDTLLDPAFDDAVAIGVASHNLFDIAWAGELAAELQGAGRPARLEFEMLEGMANAQAEAVRKRFGTVLLYTPVVSDDDFSAAIAYLVRRLDENTSPENFLSTVFDLQVGSARWNQERAKFADAVIGRHSVTTSPRRTQSRDRAPAAVPLAAPFDNEPDTDFTSAANRRWATDALAAWQAPSAAPVVTVADVDAALARSLGATAGWAAAGPAGRAELVNRVADVVAARRGDVLAAMAHTTGKTVVEGDPEISEAIDFARYYARRGAELADVPDATPAALGVVVVAPPWNFPYAIPLGGVLAALAAGNTVILKPAPQAEAVGRLVAEHCWAAGIPTDVLQYLPCADDQAGTRLISHPDVAAVVLTGAYETAEMFLDWRPELRVHAETSGKNALLITAAADVDLAIKDLVKSAFGHAGQKCSAASLAIVEASLYDQPAFRQRLADAVATLVAGPATDPGTDVGPLVGPPSDRLYRALTRLEPGERWLVEPALIDAGSNLWSPGVRWDVKPGSWFATTECFGPVLGVIRATDLDDAIQIQNTPDYGLTAGIHTLDEDEIARWLDRVEAGNLYVNRGTTGAIVRRQPFGGWKRSVVGPTVKAGGPRYVASLCQWADDATVGTDDAASGFRTWAAAHLHAEDDPSGLVSERNVLRLRPLPHGVLVRFGPSATDRQRALLRAAAAATGARVQWSEHAEQPDADCAARLALASVDRLRLVGYGPHDDATVVRRAAHRAGVAVDDAAPVTAADIELPRWLREQAVALTMHRHGRLTAR